MAWSSLNAPVCGGRRWDKFISHQYSTAQISARERISQNRILWDMLAHVIGLVIIFNDNIDLRLNDPSSGGFPPA